MNKDEQLKDKLLIEQLREAEKQRLRAYPEVPYSALRPSGVLLSDEIEFYCDTYKLVDPCEKKNIKAASYELRVGNKYAIGKDIRDLSSGQILEIPKFEVVVVEILETINMPEFLIGRWNIRTRWAYAGLIWVGGPQVNPGYRGRIMCPLWNLSNRTIPIAWGDAIAVMDFVTTTPPTEKSNRQPIWHERTRFVFEEYVSGDLRSGLVTEAVEKIKTVERKLSETRTELDDKSAKTRSDLESFIDRIRDRVDSTTAVMFTAMGVLIAALAIFTTKPPGTLQYWWEPSVFMLSWATTVFALFAWVRSGTEGKWWKYMRLLIGILVLGIIALQLHHSKHESIASQETIQNLTDRINSFEGAQSTLKQQMKNPVAAKTPASNR